MADEQFDVFDEEHEIENDYEELIRYYFYKGFTYEEICKFLSQYHNKEMSLSTLKRHIKRLGFRRRNAEYDIALVRNAIMSLLEGPDCSRGYRSIWHTLQMNGMRVPRLVVKLLLREIDPEGVSERRKHRLKRRIYYNPGPNYTWLVTVTTS
jgi:hypothetical protein